MWLNDLTDLNADNIMRYFQEFIETGFWFRRFKPQNKFGFSFFFGMNVDVIFGWVDWGSQHIFVGWNNIILNVEKVVIKEPAVHILDMELHFGHFTDLSYDLAVAVLNEEGFDFGNNNVHVIAVSFIVGLLKFDWYHAFFPAGDEFILGNWEHVFITFWYFCDVNIWIEVQTWVLRKEQVCWYRIFSLADDCG